MERFGLLRQGESLKDLFDKYTGEESAFEEMIKFLGSLALKDSNIEIILQRDLSALIKTGEIDNEPRDISWLKEQINASIFDLYAIVHVKEKKYCFGWKLFEEWKVCFHG